MLHCSLLNDRPPWSFAGADLDLDFANGRGWIAPGRNALRDLLTVTRASVGYAEYQSGVWLPSASGVARITDKGLLVEEARTNSIRNNSMQGAVVGTPGTMPTNWTSALNGATQTIVGTGTENGVEYIDIRLSGTTSGAGNSNINLDSTTGIAASENDVLTQSVFLAVVAGDTTNISSIQLNTSSRTGAGAFISNHASGDIKSSLSDTLVRLDHTVTLSDGPTVARALPAVYIAVGSAVAIDITLRIGWPQLEEGAFVTSPIRTTTAAATRAADVILRSSSFGTAGTIYAEGGTDASGQINVLLSLDDATGDNRIQLRRHSNSTGQFQSYVSGDQATLSSAASWTIGETHKLAAAFNTDDFSFAYDGTLATPDTSGSVPTVTRFGFGSPTGNTNLNGYLRRVAYYPTRLTDAQLQALTT